MGWATQSDVPVGVGIDIMYSHHFAHNEVVESPEPGLLHNYKLSAGNVIPGTLTGSVYLNDQHLGIFKHEDPDTDKCVVNNPTGEIVSVWLHRQTATVSIVWHDQVNRGESKVIVSYEYHTKD